MRLKNIYMSALGHHICLFFNWDSLHARLNSHYEALWNYEKKKYKKIKAYKNSAQKEPTDKRCLKMLDLKAIQIIGQMKAFYRQRTPEHRCARNEAVDIDILVKSRNGDRKIMESIRITSRPRSRIRKWNQLGQVILTSTKVITYRKDLNWLHFNDEARVQEK